MIQDIDPSKLYNEFINCSAADTDRVMVFDREGRILLGDQNGHIVFPEAASVGDPDPVYLFSVDDDKYFLSLKTCDISREGFSYYTIREARDSFSGKEIYAVFTAYHLWVWYTDNRFCGKCTAEMITSENERALVCPQCGHTIYPRINPAVIVGVIKDDCLLVTQYRRGFRHSALVAGFTEIGETLEETVAREVMEETGIRVRNIRDYKSQPWGMAQDILVGFYCEADGDCGIRMDENELAVAKWVRRDEIELQPNNLSLTNEMLKMFKTGQITAAFVR